MKTVFHDGFGSPDVLDLRDADTSAASDDSVLISVHASATRQHALVRRPLHLTGSAPPNPNSARRNR
jgi:NADPH:quinone reductase-like Zn-dependent oxidoreductase